jgi:N-acetylglucosamine-6-sulfatase
MRNLARRPEHAQTVQQLNRRLFELLDETDGLYIPLYPDRGGVNNKRRQGGSRAADFPDDYYIAPKK